MSHHNCPSVDPPLVREAIFALNASDRARDAKLCCEIQRLCNSTHTIT